MDLYLLLYIIRVISEYHIPISARSNLRLINTSYHLVKIYFIIVWNIENMTRGIRHPFNKDLITKSGDQCKI